LGKIWAKSKSCISKNSRSPTAMNDRNLKSYVSVKYYVVA